MRLLARGGSRAVRGGTQRVWAAQQQTRAVRRRHGACVRRRAAGSQEALVFRITNDEAIYHTTSQLGSPERFTRAARSGCVSVCVCFVCTLAYDRTSWVGWVCVPRLHPCGATIYT